MHVESPEVEAQVESLVADYEILSRGAHPTKHIVPFLMTVSERLLLDPDLAHGVGNLLSKKQSDVIHSSEEVARAGIEIMTELDLLVPDHIHKAKSLNYIGDKATLIPQLTENARYMVGMFGQEFFERQGKNRARFFRAPIGNTGFAVTAKGGSGAGTFSLDLAVAFDKWGDDREFNAPMHELWRLGIDTLDLTIETSGQQSGKVARLIRTGSGIKHSTDHDNIKRTEFARFRQDLAMLPQRALTATALFIAHEMNVDEMRALTTKGATQISTLGRSSGGADYDGIHDGFGFTREEGNYWAIIPDLHDGFYSALTSNLLPHEPRFLEHIIDAFNNLKDKDGNDFPLNIFGSEPTHGELENQVVAFMDLQGARRHS